MIGIYEIIIPGMGSDLSLVMEFLSGYIEGQTLSRLLTWKTTPHLNSLVQHFRAIVLHIYKRLKKITI